MQSGMAGVEVWWWERRGFGDYKGKKEEDMRKGTREERNICVLSAKRVKLVKGNKGGSLIA